MLFFNYMYENVTPPVNSNVSGGNVGTQINNNANSVASSNNANINKMTSSNVQSNTKIDNSDREIASLVSDTHNL